MRDPMPTGATVPVGNYAMAARTGDLLFPAGHGAVAGGRLITPRLGQNRNDRAGCI